MAAPVRGAFIVLEGLDRSGKTTQAKLLEEKLSQGGRRVKLMRFPDRSTPIGQMIDSYLKSQTPIEDHAIHLLFSANRWEAAATIDSLLASGTTIVCDRYYHSGIVYSAAKLNPTLTLSWARLPELGLPRPDVVLFLDLDEPAAAARAGYGTEAYERPEMQRHVRELFWGLSMGRLGAGGRAALSEKALEKEGGNVIAEGVDMVRLGRGESGTDREFRQEEEDIVVLDAGGSVEEVAEQAWKIVEARVAAVERGEVGTVVRRVS